MTTQVIIHTAIVDRPLKKSLGPSHKKHKTILVAKKERSANSTSKCAYNNIMYRQQKYNTNTHNSFSLVFAFLSRKGHRWQFKGSHQHQCYSKNQCCPVIEWIMEYPVCNPGWLLVRQGLEFLIVPTFLYQQCSFLCIHNMNYCNHYNWHTSWLRLGQYLSSSTGKFTELEGGKPQSNISLIFSISLAAAAAPAVSSYCEDNSPSSTDIVNQLLY